MDIVILGAGYGGLRTALDLADFKRKGELEGATITLVDRNEYHQVITWLHEVAAAKITPDKARIPFDRLFTDDTIRLVKGMVRGIAPREQRVMIEGGEMLSYDRLVIGLSSGTAWAPIPGLKEHALPMRWWDESLAIREAILSTYAEAATTTDPEERRRLMTTIVMGGGYTGCQLAGELTHWLPTLADQYNLSIMDITLRQIEAKPRLLPGWDAKLAERAEQTLRRKGVQILLDSPVEAIDAKTITVKDKPPMAYGVAVWAGGVKVPELLAQSGFATGAQGRVKVDENLRAEAFPSVYVIGDAALWMQEDKPLPQTASHALRQGEYVARMLRREVNGRGLAGYEPTDLGLVVSLGGNDGVGTALGVPLSGVAAGILKEGIEAWYLSTIK
jgi:NADH:ubiquinone reductase (H+-translocating)